MRQVSWRSRLRRRLGWSLGAASIWTWGLLLLRMLRDGLQPLEVWFGYSLSFLMTGVYVYIGLLIYATFKFEKRASSGREWTLLSDLWRARVARAYRLVSLLGVAGLAASLVALVGWLALRYPGPQAVSGTYGSIVLALMILGVAVVSTVIAREPE